MKTKDIIIKKSRLKQVSLLIISLFVIIDALFIAYISFDMEARFRIVIIINNILAILLFGYMFITSLKNMINIVGLTITDKGVYNTSTYVGSGLINWENIEDIRLRRVIYNKFICVDVNNTEFVINSQTNLLKRIIARYNFKNHGSPIKINANGLSINHKELLEILRRKWDKNKTNHNSML